MSALERENTLQQYFDGELPAEEAAVLRAELEDDEDLRAKLEGLVHLRTLLRVALAPERISGLDGEALFASIESRLDEDEDDEDQDEVEDAQPEEHVAAPRPLRAIEGGKKTEPAEDRRGATVWIGVVGGALAAAAAVWFFVLRPADSVSETGTTTPPIAETLRPEPGSEIEDIDFGFNTGAIFQVEGPEGASYAVIWISDEKPRQEIEVPEEGSP